MTDTTQHRRWDAIASPCVALSGLRRLTLMRLPFLLKRKRPGNDSYWPIGRPDIAAEVVADYDGHILYPRQAFFPMADTKNDRVRRGRSLEAAIDEEQIEMYRGAESLPFVPGKHRWVAVKIVEDRGVESLRVVEVG